MFVVTDLTSNGNVISSNLIYLAPTFEIHLPPAPLKSELTKAADGYHVKVTSPVLARDVYVSFGNLDGDVSDNYFDLLPGQTAEVLIKSNADENALRSNLKVISLVDAFPANATGGQEAAKQ